MYLRLIVPLALLAIVKCKDIEQGQVLTEAHKIFDEKREASPAIWRQTDQVIVNTTNNEVISRVVVTDLRENKDGEANIIEGGVGKQTVTIELKSPTVWRGYEFHIEVYAVPNTKQLGALTPAVIGNNPTDNGLKFNAGNIQPPKSVGADISTKPPVPLSTDIKLNDGQNRPRITRSPEEVKLPQPWKEPVNSKNVPVTKTAESEAPVHPQKSLQDEDSSPSTPYKEVKVTTQLPTTTSASLKTTDEHHIHARDTKNNQPATQSPSTVSTKSLKEDDEDIVQPQPPKISGNADKPSPLTWPKISETDRPLNPNNKDHTTAIPSTTTTGKARAVRDTDVTAPKTEQGTTERNTNKNIQKIPSNGRIPISTDVKDSQDGILNTGLDKKNENGTPATNVPKLTLQTRYGQDMYIGSTVKPPKAAEPSESKSVEDKTLSTTNKPKGI